MKYVLLTKVSTPALPYWCNYRFAARRVRNRRNCKTSIAARLATQEVEGSVQQTLIEEKREDFLGLYEGRAVEKLKWYRGARNNKPQWKVVHIQLGTTKCSRSAIYASRSSTLQHHANWQFT